jgi:hypothetical protein
VACWRKFADLRQEVQAEIRRLDEVRGRSLDWSGKLERFKSSIVPEIDEAAVEGGQGRNRARTRGVAPQLGRDRQRLRHGGAGTVDHTRTHSNRYEIEDTRAEETAGLPVRFTAGRLSQLRQSPWHGNKLIQRHGHFARSRVGSFFAPLSIPCCIRISSPVSILAFLSPATGMTPHASMTWAPVSNPGAHFLSLAANPSGS